MTMHSDIQHALSSAPEARRYARKSEPTDVLVGCVVYPSGLLERNAGEVCRQVEATGNRFGFMTRFGTDIDAIARPRPGQMSHLIAILDRPYDAALVSRMGAALRHWSSTSAAFAYAGDRQMYACEPHVEAAKRQYANRLNFLFPDEVSEGIRFVSLRKLIDNAVCDTVRVKYLPEQTAPHIELPPGVRDYFLAASALYEREHMYLRAPSDGYIATRCGDGGAFFITATFTNKIGLDLERIALVHGYDRASNTLTYSGPYLPSSDAVEAAILLARAPHIEHVLHTHASKLFTRNPVYRERVLVPQLPYGEPALGDALADALQRVGDGFVIMEEHGDIFAGNGDHRTFLQAIAVRCAEARRAGA